MALYLIIIKPFDDDNNNIYYDPSKTLIYIVFNQPSCLSIIVRKPKPILYYFNKIIKKTTANI